MPLEADANEKTNRYSQCFGGPRAKDSTRAEMKPDRADGPGRVSRTPPTRATHPTPRGWVGQCPARTAKRDAASQSADGHLSRGAGYGIPPPDGRFCRGRTRADYGTARRRASAVSCVARRPRERDPRGNGVRKPSVASGFRTRLPKPGCSSSFFFLFDDQLQPFLSGNQKRLCGCAPLGFARPPSAWTRTRAHGSLWSVHTPHQPKLRSRISSHPPFCCFLRVHSVALSGARFLFSWTKMFQTSCASATTTAGCGGIAVPGSDRDPNFV